MTWVRFAKEAVIPEGSARVKFYGGLPVMVLRSNGRLYAYVALCSHKYYVLCERSIREGRIVCPGHGEIFVAETGVPTLGKARRPLVRLNIEVRGGDIYVELPSREVYELMVRESMEES